MSRIAVLQPLLQAGSQSGMPDKINKYLSIYHSLRVSLLYCTVLYSVLSETQMKQKASCELV